ncbi:MAG: aminoacyl-histidine dipeptidase [Ignavibacteria bacterium]|nr:aminoacyl-histidine dipeptidase [Ignavibacteria bacterium]
MSYEAINGLLPKFVWERFYELTQIPRPSKKEEKVREYVRDFAKKNKLEFNEDSAGNIVIKLPATKGFENAPCVVLQGHVDMVCEKNKGTNHNFETDPLNIRREGDWIKATGTTLGADNGIGVAAAFAVVNDETAVHGPIEILCTVDEETGMTGVNNLQPGFITGKYLLNMDSEEDGTFYVGCSGGQDTAGLLPLKFKNANPSHECFEVMITGLLGGHSGLDIHRGRANAIKMLARLLKEFEGINFEIAEIKGGSLRNAIPREAEVLIITDKKNEYELQTRIQSFIQKVLLEYKKTDPGVNVKFEIFPNRPQKVFNEETSNKIIDLIFALPHGVSAMNPDLEGLVETSSNLAVLAMEADKLRISTSQRSSIESSKKNIAQSVKSCFNLAGADITEGDGYPGWQPDMDAELLKISTGVYKKLFGSEPEIKAIHAGLETGILGSKYPGLQMISFGPTIMGAHSPDERINIEDVEKFYKLLKGIVAEIAGKK